MTTDSLFSTCSTTKAFTAAAASLAIQDSKKTAEPINWDTPIAELIRDDCVLADEHATNHTTLEDALSHRSGLPGLVNAMLWARPNESLRDAVRKLRYIPLAHAPRTTWDYCNHMYMAVSHALEQKTGIDLGTFLEKRIWDPLGMKDTYFSIQDVAKCPKIRPRLVQGYTYVRNEGTYTPEPHMNYAPTTGAGSMVSTVQDYALWLRVLINKSSPLSDCVFDPLIKPRSFIFDNDDLHLPRPYHLYALGWFVDTYAGNQLYWHTGSWPGSGSLVGFMPKQEFGFAVMGNSNDARAVGKAIYIHLLEKMLGLNDAAGQDSPVRTSEGSKKEDESVGSAMKRLFPDKERSHAIQHALPIEEYTGTYQHPGYGPLPLSLKEGMLSANLEDRVIATRVDLAHVNGEFFLGKSYSPSGGGIGTSYFRVRFEVGVEGRVKGVGMEIEPALKEMIWFKRDGNDC